MPVSAQAPAGKTQQPPTIQRTTRLVEVSVIVQHPDGRPAEDLTREDFTVLDEGQEQTIALFSSVARRTVSRAEQTSPAPPQNTFTNRPADADLPNVTVILFDALNTPWAHQSDVRERILRFLAEVRPPDRVALYALESRLRVLQGFTSDARALAAALERYRGYYPLELEASRTEIPTAGLEHFDRFVAETSRLSAEAFLKLRVQRTFPSVTAIARHLRAFPGRKTLLWVSGSFPLLMGFDRGALDTRFRDQQIFNEALERAARASSDAHLAIYPIDARGLFADAAEIDELRGHTPDFISGTHSVRSNDEMVLLPVDQARLEPKTLEETRRMRVAPPFPGLGTRQMESTRDVMLLLADRTGGRAFAHDNQIEARMREAVNESRVSYILGFYPRHSRWNGSFREIQVRVKRPGLRVRHRRGYVAEDPARDKRGDARSWLLGDLAGSPLDATGLPLTGQIQALPEEPARVRVTVRVEPQPLWMQLEKERWRGTLDFLFALTDAEGYVVSGVRQQVEISLEAATHARVEREGLRLTQTLAVPVGAVQLRVVVGDARSDAVGSLSIPLPGSVVRAASPAGAGGSKNN